MNILVEATEFRHRGLERSMHFFFYLYIFSHPYNSELESVFRECAAECIELFSRKEKYFFCTFEASLYLFFARLKNINIIDRFIGNVLKMCKTNFWYVRKMYNERRVVPSVQCCSHSFFYFAYFLGGGKGWGGVGAGEGVGGSQGYLSNFAPFMILIQAQYID